jgi:Ca2+-binding RTX toxin-like protein
MRRFLSRLLGSKSTTSRRGRPTNKARLPFAVESLEDRCVPSTLQILNGVLTYNASAGIVNNVKIAISGNNYIFTDTREAISAPGLAGDGTTSVTIPTGFVGSMVINLFDQNDALVVESTVSPITIKAGDGNDVLDVGKFVGGTLSGIQAAVTVDGEAGTDTLRVNDAASGSARTYTVTATKVTPTGGSDVNYAAVERLNLTAGNQNDTFFIRSTQAGTTTTINGGLGADTFNVGNASNTLDDIKGPLVLLGGATDNQTDRVNLLDQGSSVSNSYVVRDTSVARSGGVLVVYREMEQLTLNAGAAADGLVVLFTAASSPVTLNMGGGNDVIDIATRTGSSLDLISSTVTVNGEAGTDTVNLNDQMDTNANSYAVTAANVTRNGNVILSYAAVEKLNVNGGAFDDTAAVQSSIAATPVTLKMGAGNDTVRVSSTNFSLDPILGGVNVDGQTGADLLIVDDQGDADFNFYTVTATDVTRLGGPPVAYAGTESLIVNGSVANPFNDIALDFFRVKSTSVATTLNAALFIHTSFSIGNNAGSLDDIHGPLTLNTAGLGDIVLFDDAEVTGNSYTVTDHSIDRAGAALISYGLENSLLLETGSGNDIVNVTSTDSVTGAKIDLGGGNDTLTVGGGFQALDAIAGKVTVYGEAGADAIVVDDQAPAVGANDYRITSTDVTRNGRSILSYAQAESLTLEAGFAGFESNTIHLLSTAAATPVLVRGGQDSDTFKFDGVDASGLQGAVTIDGQGGTDTLDYSAYFFPIGVRVNLALGTATGVAGGVSNVENVIGGPADDILVGNDQANVLTGGPGRDILIGRGGADVLNGGVGDDILIGCSTDYDLDPAALEDIMAEWGRYDLDVTYFGRIQHLLGRLDGGYNGTTYLTLGHLTDDGVADQLNGGNDFDWFFKLGADTLPDRSLNERVN